MIMFLSNEFSYVLTFVLARRRSTGGIDFSNPISMMVSLTIVIYFLMLAWGYTEMKKVPKHVLSPGPRILWGIFIILPYIGATIFVIYKKTALKHMQDRLEAHTRQISEWQPTAQQGGYYPHHQQSGQQSSQYPPQQHYPQQQQSGKYPQ